MNTRLLAMLYTACANGLPVGALALGVTASCSSAPVEHTGAMRFALATSSSSGHEFRLLNAKFTIAGPKNTSLSGGTSQTTVSTVLPVGAYSVTLESGWTMQTQVAGVWLAIDATLTQNPTDIVTVSDGQTTSVVYQFSVNGQDVVFGSGTLAIGINVSESGGGAGGGSATGGSATGGSATGGSATGGSGGGTLFTAANVWTNPIDVAPLSPQSSAIVARLAALGGWGTGLLRIDTSLDVLQADSSTPFLSFTPNSNFFTPDCQNVPFPVPVGGAVQGETGYQCTGGGDCHLLVADRGSESLYEMFDANIVGSSFDGGCAVRWDLTRTYPSNMRGDGCVSTDVAGLPIAPLLATADEVASGSVNHALFLALPNDHIRSGVYVHPASHAGAGTGPLDALPMGARLRLRASFPIGSLPVNAQPLAGAMQRYGIILVDAGTIALSVAGDRSSAVSWASLGFSSTWLSSIQVTDMEVTDFGATLPNTSACVLNP